MRASSTQRAGPIRRKSSARALRVLPAPARLHPLNQLEPQGRARRQGEPAEQGGSVGAQAVTGDPVGDHAGVACHSPGSPAPEHVIEHGPEDLGPGDLDDGQLEENAHADPLGRDGRGLDGRDRRVERGVGEGQHLPAELPVPLEDLAYGDRVVFAAHKDRGELEGGTAEPRELLLGSVELGANRALPVVVEGAGDLDDVSCFHTPAIEMCAR